MVRHVKQYEWVPIAGDMLDQLRCKKCGWLSKTYYDGAEYAMMEFKKHKKEPGSCKATGSSLQQGESARERGHHSSE